MTKDSILLYCEKHREDMLRSDIKYLNNKCKILKKENTNLKQTLNEIREYVNSDKLLKRLTEPKINNKGETYFDLIRDDILQIIDKVLGDEK